MFSRRTPGDFAENAIARALRKRRAAFAPLLDLTESNPTRAGFAADRHLLGLLAAEGGAAYSPDPRGLRSAREAVASDYASQGLDIDPDHIVLTASSSESYSLLFKLLGDPGHEVLVPSPSYPLFEFLARLDGLRVVSYPLRFDHEWHVSADSVEALLTARTRALVVVHPNNPTGSFLKKDEARRLARRCAERGVAIIADEVFLDFALAPDARRHGTFASASEALSFALGGLSKSCALPQLKLGWIAVSGPARLRDEALSRLEFIADTYLSVGTPIQVALPEILRRKETLQAPIRERLKRNLEALRGAIAGHPELRLLKVEGGWSALIQCPATRTDEERTLMALDRGVLVHPGHFFELETGCYLVVSLLCDPAVFDEALPHLLAAAVR